MAQWAHYSTPDPEFLATFKGGPLLPIIHGVDSIPAHRAQQKAHFKSLNEASEWSKAALSVSEYRVPTDGSEEGILIRVYKPDSTDGSETFPIIIDFHGGGFSFGSIETDDLKCRQICIQNRAVVVNVDYRLAPEYPFPNGNNDSWNSVKWVFEHSAILHGDAKKGFILLGNSSGAYFSAVVTHRARGDATLRGVITGQILQAPPVAGPAVVAPKKFKDQLLSHEQNKDDAVLTPATIEMLRRAMRAPPPETPEVSPILSETFHDIPPTVLQVAGGDPLRDEGLLYHKLLTESGVEAKLYVYPGLPHAFSTFLPKLKASQKWQADFEEGIKWLLSRDA